MKRLLSIFLCLLSLCGCANGESRGGAVRGGGSGETIISNVETTVTVTNNIVTTNSIPGATSIVYNSSAIAAPPWDLDIPAGLGIATNLIVTNAIERFSPTQLVLHVRDVKPSSGQCIRFNFGDSSGNAVVLPDLSKIVVTNNGAARFPVQVDYLALPVYSHNEIHDPFIVDKWLTLTFTNAFADGDVVRVVNADNSVFQFLPYPFVRTFSSNDFNPAIHVNQVGYAPSAMKIANENWYAGSNLMELAFNTGAVFNVYDIDGQSNIFTGNAILVKDNGWAAPQPNQMVLQMDWSAVTKPGRYDIRVPNSGKSVETRIDPDYPLYAMRMAAKGIYNQICGTNVGAPYFSLMHDACHLNTTLVIITNATTQATLVGNVRSDATFSNDVWNAKFFQTNWPAGMTSAWAFVNKNFTGPIKGFHDAGDYSKYAQNCAVFINITISTCDAYPGVSGLDGLSIPFSGDGKSDLCQLAEWQADGLLAMQDTDGGVCSRSVGITNYYENAPPAGFQQSALYGKDILPTLAAAGAWADLAASPAFKKYSPAKSMVYYNAATSAWRWAELLIAQCGDVTNAYRPQHFYGNENGPLDEGMHAAIAVAIMTGSTNSLWFVNQYTPTVAGIQKWRKFTWMEFFEAAGSAHRDVAFSVISGKVPQSFWSGNLTNTFNACTGEVWSCANTEYYRCTNNAFRIAYQDESKFNGSTPYQSCADMTRAMRYAVALQKGYGLPVNQNYIDMTTRAIDWNFGLNVANKCRMAGVGQNPVRSSPSQWDRFDIYLGPPTGFQRGAQINDVHVGTYGAEIEQADWPKEYSIGMNKFLPLDVRLHHDVHEVNSGEMTIDKNANELDMCAFYWWIYGSSYSPTPFIFVPNASTNGVTQTVTALLPGVDTSLAQFRWESTSNAVSYARQYQWTPRAAGNQVIMVEIKLPNGMNYSTTNNVNVN